MKELKRIQRLLLVLCLGFLIAVAGRSMRLSAAEADEEPAAAKVEVVSIDYEELWLVVDGKDNGAVYYSDKNKKTWSEAVKETDGKYYIDIAWLKSTSSTEITIKGDLNEEVVSVTLPAKESKYKVKFNKVAGTLTFSGTPAWAEKFQWRKATSYEWSEEIPIADAANASSAFCQELEKFRVSGASIYVRIVGKDATVGSDGTVSDAGQRPGKEIKLSITKRATAPKMKVNASKLTVNTTTSMEYSIDEGENWTQASKAMALTAITNKALQEEVTIWFRKKATSSSPYSKTFVLVVPAQPAQPVESEEFSYEIKDGKVYLTFSQASKATPYEYAVVKPGVAYDPAKVTWKSVVASKTISISKNTAPEGSTIYVRKKGVTQTTKVDLELASITAIFEVNY